MRIARSRPGRRRHASGWYPRCLLLGSRSSSSPHAHAGEGGLTAIDEPAAREAEQHRVGQAARAGLEPELDGEGLPRLREDPQWNLDRAGLAHLRAEGGLVAERSAPVALDVDVDDEP